MANDKNRNNTSNSNVNKGLKYKTKNGLIMGAVIAVLALVLIGYFIYISGFLAKVIPAVKVEQTVDGQTKTIATINTPELNFYRNQLLSVYAMYGSNIDADFLATMNEEKGKTNGQLIYDSAAEQVMNVYLVNDYAEKDANFVSGADRYADYELYMFQLRAENNSYPSADQYLAAIYGTGMSSRQYREIVARQEMAQEYQEYVKQFNFMPPREDLQSTFDSDSSVFERAAFNSYFFTDAKYPDGKALEMANTVAAASTSCDTFNTALIETIGVEDAYAMGLSVEGNNTYVTNASTAVTDSSKYPEGTTEAVFNKDNIGKAVVIETDAGAFVVYVDSIAIDETPTYSYRKIEISSEAYDTSDGSVNPTEEEIVKGLNDAKAEAEKIQSGIVGTDELSFVSAVKKNTSDYDDITTGGYVSDVLIDTLTAEGASSDDIALANWLSDPSRQHGDMIIIEAADRKSVVLYYFDDCMPAWMNTLANEVVTNAVNTWSSTTLNVQNTVPYVSYDVVERLTYYAQ